MPGSARLVFRKVSTRFVTIPTGAYELSQPSGSCRDGATHIKYARGASGATASGARERSVAIRWAHEVRGARTNATTYASVATAQATAPVSFEKMTATASALASQTRRASRKQRN